MQQMWLVSEMLIRDGWPVQIKARLGVEQTQEQSLWVTQGRGRQWWHSGHPWVLGVTTKSAFSFDITSTRRPPLTLNSPSCSTYHCIITACLLAVKAIMLDYWQVHAILFNVVFPVPDRVYFNKCVERLKVSSGVFSLLARNHKGRLSGTEDILELKVNS